MLPGIWVASARATFSFDIMFNELPVPILRQVCQSEDVGSLYSPAITDFDLNTFQVPYFGSQYGQQHHSYNWPNLREGFGEKQTCR